MTYSANRPYGWNAGNSWNGQHGDWSGHYGNWSGHHDWDNYFGRGGYGGYGGWGWGGGWGFGLDWGYPYGYGYSYPDIGDYYYSYAPIGYIDAGTGVDPVVAAPQQLSAPSEIATPISQG